METVRLNDHRILLVSNAKLPAVELDTVRLQQIIRNLLDNAAKYSPANTEIRVLVKQDKRHILIGVSDQGKGISPEDRSKYFHPLRDSGKAPAQVPDWDLACWSAGGWWKRTEGKSGLSPNQAKVLLSGLPCPSTPPHHHPSPPQANA